MHEQPGAQLRLESRTGLPHAVHGETLARKALNSLHPGSPGGSTERPPKHRIRRRGLRADCGLPRIPLPSSPLQFELFTSAGANVAAQLVAEGARTEVIATVLERAAAQAGCLMGSFRPDERE
jgi:hypothetical protein